MRQTRFLVCWILMDGQSFWLLMAFISCACAHVVTRIQVRCHLYSVLDMSS